MRFEQTDQSPNNMTKGTSALSLRGSLHDLSQEWLHTIETEARKAEPAGPKNLLRGLLGQKSREVEECKARVPGPATDVA